MHFELVEISLLSGSKCRIYSVKMQDDDINLFEQFLMSNKSEYPREVQNIFDRLNVIGHETGARDNFFKHYEGNPGDGVCALYDNPYSKLRLYCIRYGTVAIVLGDGGRKTVRAWQDSDNLSRCAELMKKLSSLISEAIKDKDIQVTDNGLSGNLIITDNYE